MRTVESLLTHEGDGAEVQRLFPIGAGRMNHDPFVLWDHFMLEKGMGFPTHPHRGFEAITYLFEGSMEHKDNLGNRSRVFAKGAQRFTAGRGIEHSEMPDEKQRTTGIQLWINLPLSLKTLEADYQQVNADSLPEKQTKGVTIRTIVGEGSPVTLQTPVCYLDVSLDKGAEFNETIPENYQGLIYVVSGALQCDSNEVSSGKAIYIEQGDKRVSVSAEQNSRFMLCLGKPHNEPIRQWGPFVD